MAKSVTDFGNQVRAVFKTMSAGKLISLTVLVIATIWGLIVLISWSGRPEFVPLYSQLSAEDAGEIVAHLRDQKIPYQLSHDGSTITTILLCPATCTRAEADPTSSVSIELLCEGS